MTLPQMTPDEKRIAVGKFDGLDFPYGIQFNREGRAFDMHGSHAYCPDYPNDLNTIVRAVKKLPKDLQQLFVIKLKIIVGNRLLIKYDERTYWIDAETPEFTDALLLTIGKATL